MDIALLDTDILSELLKQHDPIVKTRAEEYFRSQSQIAISTISCYQILRWLREPKKAKRLQQFNQVLAQQIILDVDMPVLDRTADLWIEARAGGHPRDDVDLTCRINGVVPRSHASDCQYQTFRLDFRAGSRQLA